MLSRFTLSKPTQLQLPYQISPLLFCSISNPLVSPPFFVFDKLLEQGSTRIDSADNCVYKEDDLNIGLLTYIHRPTRYIALSKYKHAGTRSGLPAYRL